MNSLDFVISAPFIDAVMQPRNGKYLKIAHRGASDYAPENTLKAYDMALQMGADMCEIDVYLSRDGHPVLIHDAEVARTTDGSGRVDALKLADIRTLDAGEGERIPTLQEAMDLVGGRGGLYIELKGAGTEPIVVDAVRQNNLVDAVIVGSFDAQKVYEVKRLAPEIETACLIPRGMIDWADVCRRVRANYAHFCWESAPKPHTLLTDALFDEARQADLGVVVWHEERPEIIAEIVKRPIDAICGNRPDLL